MQDPTDPVSQRPQTEEMHWGVIYLREDLQDMRNEIRGLLTRIDEIRTAIGDEIRGIYNRLDSLSSATSEEFRRVHQRIGETSSAIGDAIRGLHQHIDETSSAFSSRLDSYFRWTMAAIVGMVGVLAALIKL